MAHPHKSWAHHLEVEMTIGAIPVAFYFLEFLTLDLIDETGVPPVIPHEEIVIDNIHHVYWDYNFSLTEVTEMCLATLPTQSDFQVPLDDDDSNDSVELDLIMSVKYDNQFIKWMEADDSTSA
jgi:hypothetical protein